MAIWRYFLRECLNTEMLLRTMSWSTPSVTLNVYSRARGRFLSWEKARKLAKQRQARILELAELHGWDLTQNSHFEDLRQIFGRYARATCAKDRKALGIVRVRARKPTKTPIGPMESIRLRAPGMREIEFATIALPEIEKQCILTAVEHYGNRAKAAKELRIGRKTLYRKLALYSKQAKTPREGSNTGSPGANLAVAGVIARPELKCPETGCIPGQEKSPAPELSTGPGNQSAD